MKSSPVLTVITALVAVACIVGAALLLARNVGLTGQERTPGHVASVESDYDSDGDLRHYAVVHYTVQGQTYRVTATEPSLWNPRIGSERTVLYDPADPEDARILTFREAATIPALLLGAGLGSLIVFRMRMRAYGLRRT